MAQSEYFYPPGGMPPAPQKPQPYQILLNGCATGCMAGIAATVLLVILLVLVLWLSPSTPPTQTPPEEKTNGR